MNNNSKLSLDTLHKQAVDAIHKAATQSGAEHYVVNDGGLILAADSVDDWGQILYDGVIQTPSDGHNFEPSTRPETTLLHEHMSTEQTQVALGKNAVLAKETSELISERAREWVLGAIKPVTTTAKHYDEFGHLQLYQETEWAPIPLDHPFLRAYREDVVLAAISVFSHSESTVMMEELITMLNDSKVISEDQVDKIVKIDPFLPVFSKKLFPNFKFGRARVDAIISSGNSSFITQNWEMIEPDSLQYAVDTTIEMSNTEWLQRSIHRLPSNIILPESVLLDIATKSPSVIIELIERGRFPKARDSAEIIEALVNQGYGINASMLMSDTLLRNISIPQLVAMLRISVTLLARLDRLGLLDSDEKLQQVVQSISRSDLLDETTELSSRLQSWIFQDAVTDKNYVWTASLDCFDHLKEEDYMFLLDHMNDILNKSWSSTIIRGLFANAEGAARQRYMSEVEPIFKKFEDEIVERDNRNILRKEQRDLEDEYVGAGNFDFGATLPGEELTPQQIIDAFETGHCVRKAPEFRDMANDASRTNTIDCLFNTVDLSMGKPTYSEVEEGVLTEYQALQRLQQYLVDAQQQHPEKKFYPDMLNNLTYIGEKEYAEAVEGIAMYWKWFLDNDTEHQLYISTAVSELLGVVKSDKYMLERILEQFSDAEMEQYKRRLIIDQDEITQKDPKKLKVVLLDDWTISGSQLREGFTAFAEVHPKLVSSVEVQLIAASRQRIASGIEGFRHEVAGEPVEERNLPIVTRAYYVAHTAESAGVDVNFARISGSHSSVDFGFSDDLHTNKSQDTKVPGLASIFRPYRQKDYTTKNIARLRKVHGIVDNRHEE